MSMLQRIVDYPQFVVNKDGCIVLDKTGFSVAELNSFYDHLLEPDCGHTFDGLLEGIMISVNDALKDYHETKNDLEKYHESTSTNNFCP